MRIHASLGALAIGLLGLASAEAFPPDDSYGAGTCAPTVTTTVFVTVPATNAVSPPFEAGPQTVTVTVPAPGDGTPQNPASPVFTVTVQTFGPGDASPYTGPRPWESRLTATALATHTVTLPAPGSGPTSPDSGKDGPASGSPGTESPGTGTSGSGSPPSGDGTGTPGTGNPGSSGGSPGDGTPFDPECATIITTTLYRTAPGTSAGSPTVDTVVATFTVTYPNDSDGSLNGGPSAPATTAAPGDNPNGDQLQPSVITRTIYQPVLASGQNSPSQDVIVETITVEAQAPNAPGNDGTFIPGVTPAPALPSGGMNGPFSVITTTLYHQRTIPGQDIVTVDTIVASFTIAFPPLSPTDVSNGGPSGSLEGTDDNITFITTTWYETTVCIDPFGRPTPTVLTHATTIASVLPLQAPPTNGPGSGATSQATADNGDLITVITETVYRPAPSPDSNGDGSPFIDTITATITATFPGDVTGNTGSGGPDIVTVIVTTLYVTATPPATGSPGEVTPSDGAILQTFTVTIPSPSPVPGGQLTGAPGPTQGFGSGIGAGNVITTSLYRTATYIGSDGQPSVSTETYVATLTASIPLPGHDAPTTVPSGPPDGNNAQVTVITQTIYPAASVPDGYEGLDSGVPGSGVPGSGVPGSGVPGSGIPGSGVPDSGSLSSGVPGSSDGSIPSVVVYTTTLLSSGAVPNDNPFDNSAGTIITVTFPNPTATGPNDGIVQTLTYFFPPATPGVDGSTPRTPTFAPTDLPSSDGTGTPGGVGFPGQVPPAAYGSSVNTGTTLPVPGSGISGTLYLTSTFIVTQTVPAEYGNGASVLTYLSVATVGAPLPSGVTALPSVVSGAAGVLGQPGQAEAPVPGTGQPQPPVPGSQPGTGQSQPFAPGSGQPGAGQPGTGQSGAPQASPGQFQTPAPGVGQPGVGQPQPLLPGAPPASSTTCTSGLESGFEDLSGTVAPAQPWVPPNDATLPGGYGFTQVVAQSPAGVPTPAQPDGSPSLFTSGALPLMGTQPSEPFLPTAVPQPPSGIPPAAVDPAQQVPGAAGDLNGKDCSTTLRTLIVTSVHTSTYFNIVPELTTTYTFPYQALVTVESTIVTAELAPTLLRRFKRQHDEPLVFANTTSPGEVPPVSFTLPVDATLITVKPAVAPTTLRRFKRQLDDRAVVANTTTSRPAVSSEKSTLSTLFPSAIPGNSTETALSSPPTSLETTLRHTTSSPDRPRTSSGLSPESAGSSALVLTASATIPVQVPICTGATEVGNQVLDFDELPVGPLYNPYSRFWFSTGFLIAPPPSVPYVPSSGGRLLEFVPPMLTNGTLDTSQFGAGIDAASDCFRFNFFGANLGCDARGENQFCEFTFTGYRFNFTLNAEAEAMSQVTWVPSCPALKDCDLTPFVVEDFNNLSSVLVTLRVDGEPRPWWADDLKVGWSDNSCDAAHCRAGTPHHIAIKRGREDETVWYWTIDGLRRLGSRFMKFRS